MALHILIGNSDMGKVMAVFAWMSVGNENGGYSFALTVLDLTCDGK